MPEAERDAKERLKTVHNESAKLTAGYLNGLAIATFAVGSLTVPFNGMAQGYLSATVPVIAVICAVASIALHSVARFLLRGLK